MHFIKIFIVAMVCVWPIGNDAQAQWQPKAFEYGVRGLGIGANALRNRQYNFGDQARRAYNYTNRPNRTYYRRPTQRRCGYYATDNGWGRLTYRRVCQ